LALALHTNLTLLEEASRLKTKLTRTRSSLTLREQPGLR
jgi:hypothetical protein